MKFDLLYGQVELYVNDGEVYVQKNDYFAPLCRLDELEHFVHALRMFDEYQTSHRKPHGSLPPVEPLPPTYVRKST